MSIKAIFFTVFDPERGPSVLHQVPEGSIVPTHPQIGENQQLFDFHSISKFIIPQQEFCDRLVTVCVKGYRVVGFPVCIQNRKLYSRNEFIFNLAFVLDESTEISMYASIVKKLARLLRNLEEQTEFLKKQIEADEDGKSDDYGSTTGGGDDILDPDESDETASIGSGKSHGQDSSESEPDISELDLNEGGQGDNTQSDEKVRSSLAASDEFEEDDEEVFSSGVHTKGKIYALCEMILEDLNNYCECMIPIGMYAMEIEFTVQMLRRLQMNQTPST